MSNSLGGNISVIENDQGLWSNPALIMPTKRGIELTSSSFIHFTEVQRHSVAVYGSLVRNMHGRALLSSLGFGQYRNNMLAIACGQMLNEKSALGLQLASQTEHFGNASPTVLRVHCGVGFTKHISEKMTLGGVTHFSAGNTGWKNEKLAIGALWKLSQPISFCAQLSYALSASPSLSLGLQYQPNKVLLVRLGWNKYHSAAFGITIQSAKMRIDFAYWINSIAGSMIQLGLGIPFSK